jgi:hypothetical protein
MGAHSVSRVIDAHPGETYGDVYRRLWDEEHREFGSDPYSGSFATTRGAVLLTSTPLPRPVAERIASVLLNDEDLPPELSRLLTSVVSPTKWGDCAAIPLLDEAAFTCKSRKVKVVHSTTGQLFDRTLRALAEANVGLLPGQFIDSVKLLDDRIQPAVSVLRPTGRRTVGFRVKATSYSRVKLPDTVYPTEAKALAAATLAAREYSAGGFVDGHAAGEGLQLDVVPVVQRDNGTLGRVSVDVKKRTSTIEVGIATPHAKKTSSSRYLFFGIAAS